MPVALLEATPALNDDQVGAVIVGETVTTRFFTSTIMVVSGALSEIGPDREPAEAYIDHN